MHIAVVILNYNTWHDTVACAESVLASSVLPRYVIIVDNASTNDSVNRLRAWATAKSILFTEQIVTDNEKNFSAAIESADVLAADKRQTKLVLLKNDTNKGYATGNNLGIRFALKEGVEAVWILNSDTEVTSSALEAMCLRFKKKSDAGLCGSLICYMDDKQRVQCRGGGKTSRWTGLSELDGQYLSREQALKTPLEDIEARLDFIYGASVMATRAFLFEVGLMDERFFLYSEEQDWGFRAQGRYKLVYAPDAIVYHKEGGSTGFSGKKITFFSLWHLMRSRLILTAKHTPLALPSVLATIVYAALRMVYRRLF